MGDVRKLGFADQGKFYTGNAKLITDVSEEEFINLLESEFRTMHFDIPRIDVSAREAESHKREMLLAFAHWQAAVKADIEQARNYETLKVAYKLFPERDNRPMTAFSNLEWTLANRARKAGAKGD